jgi:hypothetical protein
MTRSVRDPICIQCKKAPKHKANARCLPCNNKYSRSKRDLVKERERTHIYRMKNKVARRKYDYKIFYKITVEDYERMLKEQNYACAICKTPQSELKYRLSVDHNHNCCFGRRTCGKCVRGLLCFSCNVSLGKFKESKELLNNAIRYLDYWNGDKVD